MAEPAVLWQIACREMKVRGRIFTDDSGEPFFWLGDTAWNVVLRGEESEWDEYLRVRAGQGFNVIQFVTTQWRGCTRPPQGPAFSWEDGRLTIHEEALDRVDRFMEMANDLGIVAAPIMFWAFSELDPGQILDEAALITLGRRMVERWSDREVIWLLGGDGRYEKPEQVERWSRVGRAIFADHPEAVVSLHPVGQRFPGEAYAGEPWYSFVGVQTGHGQRPENLRWQLRDLPGRARSLPDRPLIDLEPNYEEMIGMAKDGGDLGGFHVRRRAWWSTLLVPPCGIVYGHNSIWIWGREEEGEQAENHGPNCMAWPWRSRLLAEGAHSMSLLRRVIESLPWTEMAPRPDWLAHQPGDADLEATIPVIGTEDGQAVLAYTPRGKPVDFRPGTVPEEGWEWIDAISGDTVEAVPEVVRARFRRKTKVRMTPPGQGRDWLLRRGT